MKLLKSRRFLGIVTQFMISSVIINAGDYEQFIRDEAAKGGPDEKKLILTENGISHALKKLNFRK